MTQISMYVTVGMNIINTVLDVVFVLGLFGMPRLGVMGVAIATTFSRFVGTIVLAIVLFKKIEKPSIFKLLKPFPKGDTKNIVKIGVPVSFRKFPLQSFSACNYFNGTKVLNRYRPYY